MEPDAQLAPRVLLAVGDPNLRRIASSALRSRGYSVSATTEEDAGQAAGYAGKDGAVYDVRIKPGTKVAEKSGEITRLSKAVRDKYIADGYGVVVGKDPRGRTEYVVLDKNAIEDVAPRAEPTDVTETAEVDTKAVGDGTVDGTQGMGTSGRAADLIEATPGAEAPAGGGLGGDLPVSVDTAVPEGQQPAPLSTSELSPDPDKPSLPDTRGKGVRFHGSTSEITSVEDGYVGSDRNFYGQGFYTSDAVAITDGYSKAKGAKNGAVYRVDEVGPVKALDMEQPVPEWLIADYEAGQYVADKSYDLVMDPDTGVGFSYRHGGNDTLDRDYHVIEAAYGFAKGEGAALKRITSA